MKLDPSKMSLEALEALEISIMAELQSRYYDLEQDERFASWRE